MPLATSMTFNSNDPPSFKAWLGASQDCRVAEAALGFKVPFGRTCRGRLVLAQDASPGVAYACPGCGSPLMLKKGEIRAAHFAHLTMATCSPESALHRGTKAWIAAMVRRRLRRRNARLPRIRLACQGTSRSEKHFTDPCPGDAWFDLSTLVFDEVLEEAWTDDGLRPDVLLLDQGRPVLGIEVLVTHAVGPEKAFRTRHPWIEMEALKLIDQPMGWLPVASHHPWTGQCKRCQRMDRARSIQCSENGDAEDRDAEECLVEFAAEAFFSNMVEWLSNRRDLRHPKIFWNCPHCGRKSHRHFSRKNVLGASRASTFGPPIRPSVILELANGTDLCLVFRPGSRSTKRKARVWLDTACRGQIFQCSAGSANPLALELRGTPMPACFLCLHCGGDCAGVIPVPWTPVPLPDA